MSTSPGTILVVDDNAATRYSTGRFLRAAGFTVREAATGQEALDLAVDAPDAVVLDVNLPDIDGFQVCRTLRAREQTARTPIIHLSATFVAADDKVQGLQAGADGYLTHPVEPPVLIATVQAFLRARNAEEAMRASEEKFRAIFDHALNGIVLMSEDLIYLEVNAAMCRILGVARSEIIGRISSTFIPPGFENVYDQLTRELDQKGSWSGTMPLLRPDGRIVDLEWNVSIHSVPGVRLAVVTDITDRRAAETERERLLASERAARTEAERANRLKDEFLATVSHELRTPLNAIVGWSHVLKTRSSNNVKDYLAGIDAIERNAKVQSQLIADLLDVARITSGKLRLDPQPLNLGEIIQTSLDEMMGLASIKNIHLEPQLPERNLHVSGDPGRIHQVISNLLTNAIKFTPDGGHVVASLRYADSDAVLAVTDTGKGISSQFLPYIFDTFRQEDASTNRHHEGLGLGLAIVKRLVDMHGGTVTAESPGENLGSTFTVRLPIGTATSQHAPEPVRPGGDSAANVEVLRGLRVLVVDDDPDARQIVRRILLDYSVDVDDAATVRDALEKIADRAPQILISDIGMPTDDGYELIRQVRAMGFTAEQLPAIALTAFARVEDRAHVLDSGFQSHLPKPLDIDILVSTIIRLARRLALND